METPKGGGTKLFTNIPVHMTKNKIAAMLIIRLKNLLRSERPITLDLGI